MAEVRNDALRINFDRKLKLEFHGTKVTSDAGLLAYRELDGVLGQTSATDPDRCDSRSSCSEDALSGNPCSDQEVAFFTMPARPG